MQGLSIYSNCAQMMYVKSKGAGRPLTPGNINKNVQNKVRLDIVSVAVSP